MSEGLMALNTRPHIGFRQSVLRLEGIMKGMVQSGAIEDLLPKCTLKHYFAPISEKYGCCAYAREIFLPKGSLVIGEIHRHQHLNFIMAGKVEVSTEFGKKHFEAPCIFISEVGLKRAVHALEDAIWVTVHQTEFSGEENLDKIRKEVIAESYAELGLIDSLEKMEIGGVR